MLIYLSPAITPEKGDDMKTSNEKRKISVRVWAPLLLRLNELATAACLNRDAYLDIIFRHESQAALDEVAPSRNSEKARRFIKKCLMELKDFKTISLNLSEATIDAIEATCTAINIGRDSFINRVLYLLVARTEVYEQQWGVKIEDHYEAIFDGGNDIKGLLLCAPLVAIRGLVNEDPFLGLRIALQQDEPAKLHRLAIGSPLEETPKQRGLVGFNVYLPDELTPGTEACEELTAAFRDS